MFSADTNKSEGKDYITLCNQKNREIKDEIDSRMDEHKPYHVQFTIERDSVNIPVSEFIVLSEKELEAKIDLESTNIALSKPDEYEGTFTITADGDKVYEVVDGQITKDKLSLASVFRFNSVSERVIDYSSREIAGQRVMNSIVKYVAVLGEQKADGSLELASNKYLFKLKGGELQIKRGDMEILNSGGFTIYATQKEINQITDLKYEVDKSVEKVRSEKQKPKQSHRL